MICVYLNVAFQLQYDKPKLKSDKLFEKTVEEIKRKNDGALTGGKFIPIWLDSIQNKVVNLSNSHIQRYFYVFLCILEQRMLWSTSIS